MEQCDVCGQPATKRIVRGQQVFALDAPDDPIQESEDTHYLCGRCDLQRVQRIKVIWNDEGEESPMSYTVLFNPVFDVTLTSDQAGILLRQLGKQYLGDSRQGRITPEALTEFFEQD